MPRRRDTSTAGLHIHAWHRCTHYGPTTALSHSSTNEDGRITTHHTASNDLTRSKASELVRTKDASNMINKGGNELVVETPWRRSYDISDEEKKLGIIMDTTGGTRRLLLVAVIQKDW